MPAAGKAGAIIPPSSPWVAVRPRPHGPEGTAAHRILVRANRPRMVVTEPREVRGTPGGRTRRRARPGGSAADRRRTGGGSARSQQRSTRRRGPLVRPTDAYGDQLSRGPRHGAEDGTGQRALEAYLEYD